MHDIKFIRENPEQFAEVMTRRGMSEVVPAILELDTNRRNLIQKIEGIQSERNQASKEIAILRKSKSDENKANELSNKVKQQKNQLEEASVILKDVETELRDHLLGLPNILHNQVPEGANEEENKIISSWGEIPKLGFSASSHDEIGEKLDQQMNFDLASKISGSRFVVLFDKIARLERVLSGFMLDLHTTEHGYTEVSPPALVNPNTMEGTGQLPKFASDLFCTTDGRYLIPTAEVPLTNLVRDTIIDNAQLPLRYTALTPCFRSEAGAAGRDTRGMLRQHQFSKVELVSITKPESSMDELERMRKCAEKVLQLLELPHRTVMLCSGDTGFSAQLTYDLEVWLPSQNKYREISSCSVCGAFQARRMNARFRNDNNKPELLHTLNGSGIAVGRALLAILENGQQADGSVKLPKVIAERMGTDTLKPSSLNS